MVAMRKSGLTTACLVIFLASITSLKAQQPTTLLVDADHRQQASLDGSWHYIVDPYKNGLGDPDKPNLNGYAKNGRPVPGGPLQEYDFAQSSTLQVPGDWNSQKT